MEGEVGCGCNVLGGAGVAEGQRRMKRDPAADGSSCLPCVCRAADAYFLRVGDIDRAQTRDARLALAAQLDEARHAGTLPEPLADAYMAMAPPREPPCVHARPVLVRGAELASSGGRGHVSLFTGGRIKGPDVMLDDGASFLALSDAIMWARLHPFSPLHSGHRLNPF